MKSKQLTSRGWVEGSITTGAQITAARGLLRWKGIDLAEKSCVARATLHTMEHCASIPPVQALKVAAVVKVLREAGIVFLSDSRSASFGVLVQPTLPGSVSFTRASALLESSRSGIHEWEGRISVRQVKAARAMLGWAQADLASAADISAPTVKELESKGGILGGKPQTAHAIREAFEKAGIVFQPKTEHAGEGVRLRQGCLPNETTRRHLGRRVEQ